MKSTITKTIILIVFVVFLGINDVDAKVCKYWKTDNKDKETDTVTVSIATNGKSATGYYTDSRQNFQEMEVGFDYKNGCPKSVRLAGDYIYEGGKYYLNGDDNNIQGLAPSDDELVKCGKIEDIPHSIPKVTKIIYNLIQVLVPVVLVILGMLDLTKGIMAQKDDEIKKGQQVLIKRLVAAAIVFFVFALIKMFTSFLADDSSVGECLNCFIKGECKSNGPVDVEMKWKK